MASVNAALPNRRLARFTQSFSIRSFADGLNLLAWDRSGDYWNVTVDALGGVDKRLGYATYNGTAYTTALTRNGFFWESGGKLIVQCGTGLFTDTATTSHHTFTTDDRVGFADFAGTLYVTHPIDGLYSSADGSTYTAVTGAPVGSTLVAWQNRLLSAGDPGAPTKVSACKAGDATVWTTGAGEGWTNDLDEKDHAAVLRLIGTTGHDLAVGDPSLLVLKQNSAYRIYDSALGAYQTVDTAVGCASGLAAVALFGRVWVIHPTGIYSTDALSPMRLESALLAPLFDPTQVAYDQAALWAAGAKHDHLFFSLPRAGQTANNLTLEFSPVQKWIVPAGDAAAWYATYTKQTEKLYGGSPSVNGQVYEFRTGGDDDGSSIASWFQTPWFEPAGGVDVEIQRLRVRARGTFNLYVRKNYENTGGDLYRVDLPDTSDVWDGSGDVWDGMGDSWDSSPVQEYQDVNGVGRCRAVAFRVEETSTLASTAPQIFASGSAPEIGGWGLNAVDGDFTPVASR